MMRVLLLVLHVFIMRDCDGDRNAGVEAGGGVVVVSEYMGGICGFVFAANDVLEMSVVRGVRSGVCEMWMCLARGGVRGVGMRGLSLDFTNPVGTGGVWDVCLCCDGVGGLVQGLEGWGSSMSVCVVSLDYLRRWNVQVSVYCARRILAHLRYNQCSILLHLIRYLLLNMYLSVVDIANPDFIGCCCRSWISFKIACFYEEQCRPSSGFPNTVNLAPISGGRRGPHICTADYQTAVTACVCCVIYSFHHRHLTVCISHLSRSVRSFSTRPFLRTSLASISLYSLSIPLKCVPHSRCH